ncbi:MAG: hypothetical protein DWQ20_04385 [Actinobacteria bacterium]|nr:MAG: hypothetical protein DWQ20_04385 [Actinomycetota bacterium]
MESERRSPYLAMAFSGGLFLVGSVPSVLPFAFIDNPGTALALATVLAMAGLFLVGVTKANVIQSSRVKAGMENLVIAGIGGVIAWFVGDVIGNTLLG